MFYMSEADIERSIEFNIQNIKDDQDSIIIIENQLIADQKLKTHKYNQDDIKYFKNKIEYYQQSILSFERIIQARSKQMGLGLDVGAAFLLVDQEADKQLDMFGGA
ncbi:MAG: hypothetical protein WD469_12260 [Paenibacillaceae bacterium]